MTVRVDGIRTDRHCGFALHAHLVFVTKFRHRVFSDTHLARMEEIMREVCRDVETELVEFTGEHNHVHLLVNFPPKVAIAKLVNSLKGVSSRRMRQEFPDPRRHYHRANTLWSGSYLAGSVGGAPLSVVKQYIQQQNRPVQGTTRALAALPAPAFTPALKGRALARIPVALQARRHGARYSARMISRSSADAPESISRAVLRSSWLWRSSRERLTMASSSR